MIFLRYKAWADRDYSNNILSDLKLSHRHNDFVVDLIYQIFIASTNVRKMWVVPHSSALYESNIILCVQFCK